MSEGEASAATFLARGDLVQAYDASSRAIADGDGSLEVRHQQVLALARMGDTGRAMELFETHGLAGSDDPHHRAVGARLLKDRAFGLSEGPARQVAMRAAHEAYARIFDDSHDVFPGVNAATLARLAGDADVAASIAARLLADPAVAAPRDYWSAATRAEVLLLLGRPHEARTALDTPLVADCADHGARASTARQLAAIARHLGLDDIACSALVAPLAPPRTVHYCGHMFAADGAAEVPLVERVANLLAEQRVGFLYGALACGADLVVAEAALTAGLELHVVLPFELEDFLDQSVRLGGAGWEPRFAACLERAASVTMASRMEHFGDPEEYGYGSRIAMGLARLRARHLGGEAIQIALWDGAVSDQPAGTAADVAAWEAAGGVTHVLAPGGVDRRLDRPVWTRDRPLERALGAFLFTDFAGFSRLAERALPCFRDGVMGEVAAVLAANEARVVCRNSWGDALFAVIADAPSAARMALDIQERLAGVDPASMGLDATAGMRIGVHYGPAFQAVDPITDRLTFYGSEVSRAARIEPVTPPGAVFATEPFAAILALEAGEDFACRYVGRIPLAKGYGDFPMYRLTGAEGSVSEPSARRGDVAG